jgi:hypothetical protein
MALPTGTCEYPGLVLSLNSNLKDIDPVALIDSGAQGRFVDESVVANGRRRTLKRAIIVKNVDGTRNAAGTITQET